MATVLQSVPTLGQASPSSPHPLRPMQVAAGHALTVHARWKAFDMQQGDDRGRETCLPTLRGCASIFHFQATTAASWLVMPMAAAQGHAHCNQARPHGPQVVFKPWLLPHGPERCHQVIPVTLSDTQQLIVEQPQT